MPLDEDIFAPKAQGVLFHLMMFREYCEDVEAKETSETAACECLREAVEELCLSLTSSVLTPKQQGALVDALHQAEAAFQEEMPNLFGRTGAAMGFAALLDLVSPAAASNLLADRERRGTALALAQRFMRTLGVYAGQRGGRALL
jgi:hypothetical protein